MSSSTCGTQTAGFVYLPGRGEERYRLNVSTILREGQEGDGTARLAFGTTPSAGGSQTVEFSSAEPWPD
jgi:hypothetical protein